MTSKKLKFNKYWFRPRRFGLGATPTTWEGWLVVFGFLAFVFYVSSKGPNSYSFMPAMTIAIVLLVIVSKNKTKGEWKWRWG